MKYVETGFRPLYKNFCYFPLTDTIRGVINGFPGYETATGVLVYGYIDRQCGMTLDVIACARDMGDGKVSFAKPSDTTRSILRIGSLKDAEYSFIAYGDDELANKYKDRIEMISHYDDSDEVMESRKFDFLDEFRNDEHPDDVLVYLVKDGLHLEGCWVRITGLEEKFIVGTLLNEPDQDFGYHMGDTVAFFIQKEKDGKRHLFSDMNPSVELTEADLEDGSMLRSAISKFNEDRNQDNLIDVLELLRDSYVWIPCNAILSEEDQAKLQKRIEETNGNIDSLIGEIFTNEESIRMVPDILQNGEDFFFTVFTSEEAMGEYGNSFSKLQKHFLEAIPLARNNDKKPVGIVIDAFSEPMVIDKELFEVIENMKSRIVK